MMFDDFPLWRWLVLIVMLLGGLAAVAWSFHLRQRGVLTRAVAAATGHIYSADELKLFCAVRRTLPAMAMFILVGLAGCSLWALGSARDPADFLIRFASNGLIAGVALAVGGFLGFLFAIPRTAAPTVSEDAAAVAATGRHRLLANTSLERVSDWLTTLLVGATLVQIDDLAAWLWRVAGALSDPANAGTAIVAILMLYFLTLGFLCGYLITRLFLSFAFDQAMTSLGEISAGGAGDPESEPVAGRDQRPAQPIAPVSKTD